MQESKSNMPRQELVFEKEVDGQRFEVIKTYDSQFAREVFDDMEEQAQAHLWEWLVNESYAPEDIPMPGTPARNDFLWEEALDAAREDGRLSFFVVIEGVGRGSKCVYVSPDWPSSETFFRMRMGKFSGALRGSVL
jgi:hypothetical protein